MSDMIDRTRYADDKPCYIYDGNRPCSLLNSFMYILSSVKLCLDAAPRSSNESSVNCLKDGASLTSALPPLKPKGWSSLRPIAFGQQAIEMCILRTKL